MRIAYLGAGSWGFALAGLLASKGHEVVLWTVGEEFARILNKKKEHPKLPHYKAGENLRVTCDLKEALHGAELLVESVTAMGIRPVFEQVLSIGQPSCPIVITSKGIEQNSCLLLPEVLVEVLGETAKHRIGCLSGPSHAEEVVQKLPTSVVSASFDVGVRSWIAEMFSTPFFRVYPNADLYGVAFGGAMKNIIAIACGISDGLGFGDNTKAALMTRGLHEIRKLSVTKKCNPETLNGLAGLGDLCVTCLSKHSRNYTFGHLIAEGLDAQSAKEKIGMAVEGVYTCVSARQLGHKANIPVPITEAVYSIVYEGMNPQKAVHALLQRAIKEEHL
jgi:glycerol-3-phosphate dehydrogenase (NAD(P)+)